MILISDVLFFGDNSFVDFVPHHVLEKNTPFGKLLSDPFLSYDGRRHQLCCVRKGRSFYLHTNYIRQLLIQGVTEGRDQTSGGCSLCETIPKKTQNTYIQS